MKTLSKERTNWIACDFCSPVGKALFGGYPKLNGKPVRILQVEVLEQNARFDAIVEFEYMKEIK